ncbi:MAG: hypothetical protein R3195_14580 [Gemmatimonadota bacterium]|nr:hypothetical protein [Gemmatimonadota bacterium]
MTYRPRVYIFGIDALDVDLMHEWMDQGRMPFLASLRETCAFARLDSTKDLFGDAPWPSLNAGVSPATHAFFNHLQLQRGTLDIERVDARHCRALPFWEHLRGAGLKTAFIDVPKTFPIDGLDGIQVSGWSEHYPLLRSPESLPPELIDEIHATYGAYPHPPEISAPPSRKWEETQLRAYLSNIARKERAVADFLDREDWDLFFTVYAELHYADHQMFHHMDPGHWGHEPDAPAHLKDALPAVAERTDEAIRAAFSKLPPDATWIVVSVHGIEANFTANHVMEDVLQRLGYLVRADRPTSSNLIGTLLNLTGAVRRLIPQSIRDRINDRLPEGFHDQADSSAFEGDWDWEKTRAFFMPSDHFQALVSLNLAGREPRGVVRPDDADDVLAEIERDMLALRNTGTGTPAVAGVVRPSSVYSGPSLSELPDLVVQWAKDGRITGLEHPKFGRIDADTVIRRAQHAPDGFLMAGGAAIETGATAEGAATIDFAPTILSLLGRPVPPMLEGRVLHELLEAAGS